MFDTREQVIEKALIEFENPTAEGEETKKEILENAVFQIECKLKRMNEGTFEVNETPSTERIYKRTIKILEKELENYE